MNLVHELLDERARRAPDSTFLIAEGESRTFADIDARSAAIAVGLRELGVRAGDRVAIVLPNSSAFVVSLFGVLKAGGVVVALNPDTTAERLAFVLADCEVRAVIAAAHHARDRWRGRGRLRVRRRGRLGWHRRRGRRPDPRRPGVERAVGRARRSARAGSMPTSPRSSTRRARPARRRGRCSPIATCAAAPHRSRATSRTRADDVVAGDPADVVRVRDAAGPGRRPGRLLDPRRALVRLPGRCHGADRRASRDRPAWRPVAVLARSWACPTSPSWTCRRSATSRTPRRTCRCRTSRGSRRRSPNASLFCMYGLTECTRVSYLDPARLPTRPARSGMAIPNMEAWVQLPDGQRAAPGEVGELVVRGVGASCRGTGAGRPETAEALRTGTARRGPGAAHRRPVQDRRRRLPVLRRADATTCSRRAARRSAPREIEGVLYELDTVAEAVVIGVPHELDGQAVKAFIVPRPGRRAGRGDRPTALSRAACPATSCRGSSRSASRCPGRSPARSAGPGWRRAMCGISGAYARPIGAGRDRVRDRRRWRRCSSTAGRTATGCTSARGSASPARACRSSTSRAASSRCATRTARRLDGPQRRDLQPRRAARAT